MNKNKRIVEIKNNPGLKITASQWTMTGQIKVLSRQDICPAVYACEEKFTGNYGLTSDFKYAFFYMNIKEIPFELLPENMISS